jgi:dUTP pyrophosphatase
MPTKFDDISKDHTPHSFPETINIRRVSVDATLPTRAHPDDAGLDLYNLEDFKLTPGEGKMIKTGIALAVPRGFVGLVADRSSLAKRGVIDAGYRGEIHIVMWNVSKEVFELKKNERLAQLLIIPIATPAVVEVQTLDETARGAKGFGSSGR